MITKKEDRPLGNEVKFKTVKKNTKYFQGLEYREIEKKQDTKPVVNKKEEDLIILPIGNK